MFNFFYQTYLSNIVKILVVIKRKKNQYNLIMNVCGIHYQLLTGRNNQQLRNRVSMTL